MSPSRTSTCPATSCARPPAPPGGSTGAAPGTGSPPATAGTASAATTRWRPTTCPAGPWPRCRSGIRPAVNETTKEMAPPASVAADGGCDLPNTVVFMDEAAAGTIASEREVRVVGAGGDVTFGREPTAHLRIGHAPVYDDVVPKLAGRVFAHDGRLVVDNLHDTLALDIRVEGRALMTVPPGHWHSPPEHSFDVLVTGTFTYELAVTVNSGGNPTRVVAGGGAPQPPPPPRAPPPPPPPP